MATSRGSERVSTTSAVSIAGGLPRAGWQKMLQDSRFTDMVTGPAVDTFGGASGEGNARAFEVYGYAFMASKPIA